MEVLMYHNFLYGEDGLAHCECHKDEASCALNPYEIMVQDVNILVSDDILKTGDLYYAHRRGPAQILTCKATVWSKELEDAEFLKSTPGAEFGEKYSGWVVAQEPAYSFDFHECVKIIDPDKDKIEKLRVVLKEAHKNWLKR